MDNLSISRSFSPSAAFAISVETCRQVGLRRYCSGRFVDQVPHIGEGRSLCDEAKPGQILISPRVLTKVENAVKVEPVGEFALKGIRRPLAAYNVVAALASKI